MSAASTVCTTALQQLVRGTMGRHVHEQPALMALQLAALLHQTANSAAMRVCLHLEVVGPWKSRTKLALKPM